jgi:diacylglycerol kinase family enzyme
MSAMRVLLLVNSTASSVTPRKRVVIRKLLAAHHEVEVAETSRRGHATRLAHAAANDGFDVVAVLGGDGTLNEAADGLLQSSTALAPLPGGSTNVYARTLGYPNDLVAAARVLDSALARNSTKRVGIGMAHHRPILFNLGIGFDAAVVRRVERFGKYKRFAAHPLHIVAAIQAMMHKEGIRTAFDIELDTGETIEGVRFAIVSKSDPYTFLEALPLRVAPDAGLDRPLAVTAFRRFDFTTLVASGISAMRKGKFLANRRGIDHRHDIERLIVRAPAPFPYQIDGDDVGDTEHLDVTFERDALSIVVP